MITTYQIRNVLRVYGNQLKKRNMPDQNPAEEMRQSLDSVNISIEARRKQVLNNITNHLITKTDPDRSNREQTAKEKGEGIS